MTSNKCAPVAPRGSLNDAQTRQHWIDFDAATDDPKATAAAMQRLLDDELTFVDAPRSSVFIADEHIIF
jgi:hypothetical protein